MTKRLREKDISMGFRAPICSMDICIPECNICIYWNGPGKCKKLGDSPDKFGWGERHDCPDAILDTGSFQYPAYQKIYPEECKSSIKK